jgi:chorismate mutase/prephenate dehydratase
MACEVNGGQTGCSGYSEDAARREGIAADSRVDRQQGQREIDEMPHERGTVDLSDLRAQIDEIDDEMLDLFVRRMGVSERIALRKREAGARIADFSRERAILADMTSKAPQELSSYVETLFSMVMEMSRSYQQKSLSGSKTPWARAIDEALASAPAVFPSTAEVACQGVEGAFGQIACDKLFKHADIAYFGSFEGVFRAVEQGEYPFGVVPLENSAAGTVNQVYDLMMRFDFHIVRTVRVKVDHCLLAKPGMRLEDMRVVYSHPQALAQCSRFLDEHPGIRAVPVANTAQAARMVSEEGKDDVCAIASQRAGDIYGLVPLGRAIQDNAANYTRFACIAPRLMVYPGADKASFALVTPHKPGALCRVLSRLYALDINMTKLESRPIPGHDFEFMFYFDVDAPAAEPGFSEMLSQIESLSDEFRYLGSYSEIA